MTTEPSVELLTTAEVCAALDIDKATLTRWVASGVARVALRLPGRNGALLFHPEEVIRLRELRGDRKQMPRDAARSA